MKSNKKSLYFQWFGIGVLITFICVGFGVFIVHHLSKKDEQNHIALWKQRRDNRIMGHLSQRVEIMQEIISRGNLSPEEAFRIVDKTEEAPFAEASYLLDKNKNVILEHRSRDFADDGEVQDFKLTPDHYYRVSIDPRPPHHRRPGPAREAFLIGLFGICASIMTGIALSLVVLTVYLRKKASQVEEVMARIKAGELSTRFKITQADESGLLMIKFNEMADDIEGLVNNLKNTEESRTKLLQELAHDLRTPVASLKTLQETLFQNEKHLEKSQKEHLQLLAMREVSYFERLVEDLLFLSGVRDPRYSEVMRPVDLTELIVEAMETFEVSGKMITCELHAPQIISGDEHLLRRLLKNALSNATRFAKSKVSIRIESVHGSVQVTVRDDGPGLKENEVEIFGEKKFSRQLHSEEANYISIGLGSVIMKKIMHLHNGSLSIRNAGPGAELTLNFPLIQ